MSAALKIAVIMAAAIALVSSEAPVAKEKEKRGSDKEVVTSQPYQQQQQQQHRLVQQPAVQQAVVQQAVLPQHNFQYIQAQPTQQRQPAVAGNQYTQQQLQYVFRDAPGQKLGAAVASQYVQPQFQYVYHQAAADPKAVVGTQYVQQQAALPHAAFSQAYHGGQYYVHPGQASVLAAQYAAHPGAPFFVAPQQPIAQQYYVPQHHPAFYYGGLPADYQAYLGNRQAYPAQQFLPYGTKAASGVEPRGGDAVTYVQPFGGAVSQQLPQTYTLAASGGVAEGQVSSAAQAQESPALNAAVSSGKYSSKTSSERHQG